MTLFSKNFIFGFILLLLSSCSLFIELDQPKEKIVFNNLNNQKYCKKKDSLVLASQSGSEMKEVKDQLLSYANKYKLSPIEVFTSWALIQLYLRPDQVSPSSSLQFIDTNKDDFDYFSFNEKKYNGRLYFESLQSLLKKYNSKRSLKEIALIVDKVISPFQVIDKQLSNFLYKNRQSISENNSSKSIYFKGHQVLREGEALRSYSMENLLKNVKLKKRKANNFLFTEKIGNDTYVKCNFDLNIYRKGIYLIEDNDGENSHPFAITYAGQTFMAMTSQLTDPKKLHKNTYNFNSTSTQTHKAICKVTRGNKQITMISSSGRDSGQHLFNLLDYKISSSKNRDELIEILNFPRYLFLLNPKRMIYESSRSSSSQIQSFLDTGFPIYHYQNLGNIWVSYQIDGKSGLILDGRRKSSLSCL
ncbi:hypothetical protein [Halobacteriovorax sp. HLS]|uniref:hypothetical protein n=1 Tax=Halobacteriovorax sp. HLS TaxID=2234000 RepID=UPI0013E3178A|nr:hypothetical protein [Halobacteriovorax sp. HLS]